MRTIEAIYNRETDTIPIEVNANGAVQLRYEAMDEWLIEIDGLLGEHGLEIVLHRQRADDGMTAYIDRVPERPKVTTPNFIILDPPPP